jgi:hypothetical protein
VLWELVTGCQLFARESDAATLYAIMNDPIPKARRHRPNVPEELEGIINTALSRTPADRFETAEEMQGALDQFLSSQPKFDSRSLAGTLESLFGSTRAEAKRSIAATRALAKNVSLVMKLRTEVRDGLKQLTIQQHSEPVVTGTRRAVGGVAALVIVAMLAGLGWLLLRNPRQAQVVEAPAVTLASLKIDSRPAGAAVFVRGEPTGLVTPATLTGLQPGEVEVRVELSGHSPTSHRFNLKSGESASHLFELGSETGRVVLSGLPAGAIILIGDVEHEAGEVLSLPAGRHEVRILLDGKTLAQQTLETATGHQVWELQEGRLVRK